MALSKNQENFLNALRSNLGIVSKAAHACNMHRNSHFKWVKDNEEYKSEYEAILEDCIDFAEDALYNQISNGDTTVIIFYLKTKAKHRGYIERSVNEVVINKPQKFIIGGQEIEF